MFGEPCQSEDRTSGDDDAIPERLKALFQRQRAATREEGPPPYGVRRSQLDRLRDAIQTRVPQVVEAIAGDYGCRSSHETLLSEVHLTLSQLRHTRKNLRRWMRPRRRAVSWPFLPGRARITYQPLGAVGIISPWNYPFYLAMMPFLGALAAGNSILLKPSEITPRTAELLRELVEANFRPEVAAVVTGGPEVGRAFARLPFDHLLFTGSTMVGRSVLQAASGNLTPVTLELGGKSPAILGEGFPISTFAQRVVAGKLFNAGQTCIAPDYVLAPSGQIDRLVESLKAAASDYYPTLAGNPDYTSIISENHYRRLQCHVEDARKKGARVIEVNPGGEDLAAVRKFAPAIILDAREDTTVMQEEIFGPILPVQPYGTLQDAIRYVNERPRPLALYYFDNDRGRIRHVIEHTCSGGVCINDTVVQAAQDSLPFGGVGPSGMGTYHGREGFETFSHAKSVFLQSRYTLSALLRPPYGRTADRLLRVLVRSPKRRQ